MGPKQRSIVDFSRMAAVHVKRFSVKRVPVHTGSGSYRFRGKTGSGSYRFRVSGPLKNRKKSMFALFWAFWELSQIEKSRRLRFFGRFWSSHKSKKIDVCVFLGVCRPLKNRKKSMFALLWVFFDPSKIPKIAFPTGKQLKKRFPVPNFLFVSTARFS